MTENSFSQTLDAHGLTLARGETVTLVLALTPSQPIEVSFAGHRAKLPPATESRLTIHGHGILEVFAKFPQGDVSYGIRIEPPTLSG